ncbi:hypothetical protein AB0E55_27420 [Amycolatopsis keratiniphila]|uniref:hypothetical protein n=1 Tax=Amycolatopsis keratiniphila TaxID=129921 RepID=UPI0026859E1B
MKAVRVKEAGRRAGEFVESVRDPAGGYRIERWPAVEGRRAGRFDLARAVAGLRTCQREKFGFLDPVDDALFLTAGLRAMGVPASFNLGREIVPAKAPASFLAWVSCEETVVSTSVPVREEYVVVFRSEGVE